MSDDSDSDSFLRQKRKRKVRYVIEDDDDESDGATSDSSIEKSWHMKRIKGSNRNCIRDSDSSDSDSSIEVFKRKKRIGRVNSDTSNGSSSSSNSSSTIFVRKNPRAISDSSDGSEDGGFEGSSDSSQWETEEEVAEGDLPKATTTTTKSLANSSDDEEAERCPICLLRFKQQEIGTPESCDHNFCVDCIQEWSKNVNTCPVDRQPFGLILVRKRLNGKVIRQITVEEPNPENNFEFDEDATCCEICGMSDREDRMLLCDRCNLGFHLECLTPPLQEVPAGYWYCNDCGNDVDLFDIQLMLDDGEDSLIEEFAPRQFFRRLMPRTRQSERVRQRIENHRRSNNSVNSSEDNYSENNLNSSGIEDSIQAGPSTSTFAATTTTTTRRRTNNTRRRTTRARRNRRSRRSYRIVYQLDQTTGQTVQVRQKVKKRKTRRRARATAYEMDEGETTTTTTTVPVRKKKTRKRRTRKRPRAARMMAGNQTTVKRRLASQLGICRQRAAIQHLPDVRGVGGGGGGANSRNISLQRYEAGIPTLHLFGQEDEIDFFSDSDSGGDGGGGGETGVLFRRRPTRNDANILRNQMRRKMVTVPPTALPTSDDLLSSILDSQAKLHSKNSVLTLNKDGSLKVESNNNRINLNDNNARYRQTPSQPTNSNENNFNSNNTFNNERNTSYNSFIPTVVATPSSSSSVIRSTANNNSDFERPHDYSQNALCDTVCGNDDDEKEKKERKSGGGEKKHCDSISGDNTPKSNVSVHSDSELDIYSDIETVSTSKMDEQEEKSVTPVVLTPVVSATGTDDENNISDTELVIDTDTVTENDKYDPNAPIDSEESSKEEAVSSSADASFVSSNSNNMNTTQQPISTVAAAAHSTSEIQSEKVQSSSQIVKDVDDVDEMKETSRDEDIGDEDGCPNFSIYSTESINLAKKTDLELLSEKSQQGCSEISSTPSVSNENQQVVGDGEEEKVIDDGKKLSSSSNALYSDSEDDVKIDVPKSFGIGDIQNMTEDISEEERSYTPCLDEKMKACQEGLDGLDTEMISDEDRNDFDESHDLKTASDGDALEINAKDSEMDFSKPEDYEEGEIVDRLKLKKQEEAAKKEKKEVESEKEKPTKKEKAANSSAAPPADDDGGGGGGDKNKENEKQLSKSEFKKLSKSNKVRNYRDKDKEKARSRSRSKDNNKRDGRREKKKEKRKEIERYDVRTIIAEKPRRLKDKFGRDLVVNKRSASRSSSRSHTPPPYRSPVRSKRRSRSKRRRSYSRSRTPPPPPPSTVERHHRSRSRKRKRSSSSCYEDEKRARRSSRVRRRSRSSRYRSRSDSRQRRRRQQQRSRRSKEWTPLSLSKSPEAVVRQMSPSWTPPRVVDKAHNLTVILTNDASSGGGGGGGAKKKKDKKKKSEKKSKDGGEKKKKRRNKTPPPPSKEVFASGDNILVSVSFNKDNETRDVTTKRKKDHADSVAAKKPKKSTKISVSKPKKNVRDLSGVKPVAIIDLDKSPFKELTPSPKDVIVLSDSDNGENNEMIVQKAVCDSSQHVISSTDTTTITGPKTPPEPQIKFSLNPKPQQLRPITNPLHEPDETEETEVDAQEEQPADLVPHKGPNTPPDPPNSPPSSPDAYDPFDPTKSRSPTPEPVQTNQQSTNAVAVVDNSTSEVVENEKTNTTTTTTPPMVRQTTPDTFKSTTPPLLLETQPDSQSSSILTNTPDHRQKSPDGAAVAQQLTQNVLFPTLITSSSKPIVSAIPYSSSTTSVSSLITTSTPVSSVLAASTPRINILNSTILTPTNVVSSVQQQRIILPNTLLKSTSSSTTTNTITIGGSPVKIPIKSTPIKPMPAAKNLNNNKQQTNNAKLPTRKLLAKNDSSSSEVINLDFDSPYSPGSSDYEDLFEPPPEGGIKAKATQKVAKTSPVKTTATQNAFDTLFGASPIYSISKSNSNNNNNNKGTKSDKAINKTTKKSNLPLPSKGTKQIGVKLDEDNLKILDELPNSAVEMQVKDKFLKKLNRQERVVEEVKLVLKPHYNKKHITKEEYKDILRRAVPKICHNRSGEINPKKIQNLIEAYVKKIRHSKKVTSSSNSVNAQKV